jgi:membrane-associated protease RseP (regulator of RpoE activity)
MRGHALLRLTGQLGVVVALLCLAAANIYVRATWSEPEDGVLWTATAEGVVVAKEVAADSPGARAQLRAGDVLEAIDGKPVEAPADVTRRPVTR